MRKNSAYVVNRAIGEWNTTPLTGGRTPEEWFRTLKNPLAGQYDPRIYRRITGEVSKRDLSYSRGTLILERQDVDYKFDVPTDADSVALIARYMGYAPSFSAHVYWNSEGADIYTEDDVYMFTCPPQRLATKSASEADADSGRNLGNHEAKRAAFEGMQDDFVDNVVEAKEVLFRSYAFNTQNSGTKEHYNEMREAVAAGEYSRSKAKREVAEKRTADREARRQEREQAAATLDFHRKSVPDLANYTK